MGLVDSAVEELTLQKAIIEVIDRTKKQKDGVEIVTSVGKINDYTARTMKYNVKKAQVVLKQEASKLKQMATAVTGIGLGDSIELENFNTAIKDMDQDVVIRRFEVQFNPSTLSVSGSGGGIAMYTNIGTTNSEQRGTTHPHGNEYIEMSVQLTFDETINLIAFPGDLAGLNISNTADAAMELGVDMFQQKVKGRPTVQETVEGFLGVLRNEYTRGVAFCWGRMLYFGIVNRVSTKYTLFNPSGKPIRATVDLSIVCTDASVSSGNLGYWEEKYKDFFKPEVSLSGLRNSQVNLTNFSR